MVFWQHSALWLVLTVPLVAGSARAQVTVRSGATEITLGGRLHTQFNSTSVSSPATPGTEFLVRRARFDATVKINDFVSGFVQPEYGGGKALLQVGYLRLTFSDAARVVIGQFKRPFDLFEITSSNDILVVERAGGIRGIDGCTGVEGLCSLSQFTERLQLAAPDIGVMVEGTLPGGRVSYMAAVTNGAGANRPDENGAKSASGRLAAAVTKDLRVGLNLARHDFVNVAAVGGARDEATTAIAADVEYGNFVSGPHVQAEVVAGGNWLNLVAAKPSTFAAAQVIMTYKRPLAAKRYASAIEPLIRYSWGDPNRDNPLDHGRLYTPGVIVHFAPRNKMAANVDLWRPAAGPSAWSLKLQSYLVF